MWVLVLFFVLFFFASFYVFFPAIIKSYAWN